ncbi:hypothetical protein A2U01_0106889, partial [Trifolium medium]|nr:hypothetical protein [Trifolium medium]
GTKPDTHFFNAAIPSFLISWQMGGTMCGGSEQN